MTNKSSAIEKTSFGTTSAGQEADLYKLTNASGAQAWITTYGGTLTKLFVPDRNGKLTNVVLGFESIREYEEALGYFGATIGRYANRIVNAQFTLDGTKYTLNKNNGENTLHGGKVGFDKKIWSAERKTTSDGVGLSLKYVSPDMEEGFPGEVTVDVEYMLRDDNSLAINFRATTSKATPINLTNHSYFNLNGKPSTILDHELWIDADRFTEINDTLQPTGELPPVAGTAMDFNEKTTIGKRIKQLKLGYDHNWCLRDRSLSTPDVKLSSPETGIELTMYTDQPGVQVYSGNFMVPEETCGAFKMNYGVTLETQFFPDSVNQPQFPNTILRPGETYTHNVIYAFGTV